MVSARIAAALVAGACVLCALSPRVARAQDEDARRLFLQGRELAASGDWEGALTRWQASFVLVERASTAVSMAHALVRLERWDEATAALDDLERLADPGEDSDLLSSGRALRDEIAAARPVEAPEPEEPEATDDDEPTPPPPGPGFDVGVLIGPLALAGGAVLAFVLEGVLFALREDSVAARDALCPPTSAGEPRCPTFADFDEASAHAGDAVAYNDASNAMLAIGLTLAVGAAVWLTVALVLPGESGDEIARVAREGVRW